ncbi:hypothetical protein C5167_023881 [Papaver somniferum]|uniref:Glycosyltransferase n=1 Tax=Papaver somniferum TaxID=3469 RepID=A0A4Y7JM23_PAPSO|nr:hypothetical protein C5167_023881 [Papaver somniferum]
MGSQEGSSASQLHVVMFPWFAFGHITPFVQLSNKLASHGVQISFLSAPGNIQRISLSLSSSPLIKIIPVHIPPVDGLPPGLDSTSDMSPALADLLKIAADKMQPQIKSILIDLKPHIIFIDFEQHWIPSIASSLGIKTFNFTVFAAACEAYVTNPYRESPTIDDLKKPPPGFPTTSISSLSTYQARDFLYPFMSLKEATLPVLLTGPIVPDAPKYKLEEKWENWLQKFPAKSVLFCSFGSETFLTDEQIKELVLGLEETGLPFFVVLNFPPGDGDSNEKLKNALPAGFAERVQGKGVVHTGWVQQQAILAHDSVGCYVNHSGLSSVIEAFINDCQLVMLPQKGDQFLNSMLISGDLKAGVQVIREDEDGHFNKEDLRKAVKVVTVDVNEEPGKSISANHGKWRDFLLNKDIQDGFITNLVEEMKKMVN